MDHVNCYVLSFLHHCIGQSGAVVVGVVQKRFVKITEEDIVTLLTLLPLF